MCVCVCGMDVGKNKVLVRTVGNWDLLEVLEVFVKGWAVGGQLSGLAARVCGCVCRANC